MNRRTLLLAPGQVAFVVLLALVVCLGCRKSTPPPMPLTVQELPAALQTAFNKAKPEPKALAGQVVAAVQAQDYPAAFLAIQNLANSPGLTKEQMSVTSRATLTVNALLQEAQTKGDAQAEQTLQNYRRDK